MDYLRETGISFNTGEVLTARKLQTLNDTINQLVRVVNNMLEGKCDLNVEFNDFNREFTLKEAIESVSKTRRHLGMKVRFLSSEQKKYLEYSYLGTNLNDNNWTNTENWVMCEETLVDGGELNYKKPEPEPEPKDKYLTFTALESNSSVGIDFYNYSTSSEKIDPATFEYSLDNGNTWNNYTWEGTEETIVIGETIKLRNIGDTIKFKGTNQYLFRQEYEYGPSYHQFKMDGSIEASGDVTSLLNNEGGDFPMPSEDNYILGVGDLFGDCTALKTVPNLPATTLSDYCYQNMFSGCTGLTSIPSNLLPATTLSNSCYQNMFYGCTGLTSIPSNLLPATTLSNSCYQNMFYGCTGLTSIPSNLLPATTLSNSCYATMFMKCTSLTNIPFNLLPATTLSNWCYSSMFNDCTSLTTAPDLPATTLSDYCYSSMFSGCTGLTSIPSNLLPATTLNLACYMSMFSDCTGLTSIPSNLLPATTLNIACYNSMFRGCTSLTTAPELPATTLSDSCYSYMFQNCTNLNYIKCLATNISAVSCTSDWVSKVSNSGTFVKSNSMTSWTTGNNGIPTGWIVKNY